MARNPTLTDEMRQVITAAARGILDNVGNAAGVSEMVRRVEYVLRVAGYCEHAFHAEQLEAVDDARPGWRLTIGQTGDPTAFRKWLEAQPFDYCVEINTTYSAEVLLAALDKFEFSRNGQSIQSVADEIEAIRLGAGARD